MIGKDFRLPITVFILTFILLAFVQIMVERPMILAERFIKGAGWLEILIISFYGAIVIYNMQDPRKAPYWRKVTWIIFSAIFFSQLVIGLMGSEKFLMTGRLHLPIPVMILAGPIFRGELSVMVILFLSTIILTGPAWCSHLCYFGSFDNLISSGKSTKDILRNKASIKATILMLVIGMTLLLRAINISLPAATLIAIGFGVTGILVMIFISMRMKKMVHCVMFCPIGTIVNLLKHINPFRMYIEQSCTLCMNCTKYCNYDALNAKDIRNMKPSITCTLCGDCLAGCHHNSIKYKFFYLRPEQARNLYLILTISLHATCIALARI